MANLTENQQQFWDVLTNPYPHRGIRRCLNCIYFKDLGPNLQDYRYQCFEPKYIKINKSRTTCGPALRYVKWKWNGKVYSEEEWNNMKRDGHR